MTQPIGPSYQENRRNSAGVQRGFGIQIEAIQYPADQARRETLALLRQIRNGVSFIAVVALFVGLLILIDLLAAVGS